MITNQPDGIFDRYKPKLFAINAMTELSNAKQMLVLGIW
jgi:hypothetical protein